MLDLAERHANGVARTLCGLQGERSRKGSIETRDCSRIRFCKPPTSWRTTASLFPWVPIRCNTLKCVATLQDASIINLVKRSCLPKANVLDASAKVSGTNGEKMSKSYGNTLPLFGESKKDPQADHAN